MSDSTQKAPHATFVERRTFIRNAGAALSATVTGSTAAVAAESPSDPDTKKRVEDEVHRLHHTFVERLNSRRYDQLSELFACSETQPPRVAHFDRDLPETVLPPVHDYLVGHEQHLDSIEVAPDRRNARALYHCLTRMEAALNCSFPLIEMARQQGQGAIRWWESGVLETTYVRSASGWQIGHLSFRSNGQFEVAGQIGVRTNENFA